MSKYDLIHEVLYIYIERIRSGQKYQEYLQNLQLVRAEKTWWHEVRIPLNVEEMEIHRLLIVMCWRNLIDRVGRQFSSVQWLSRVWLFATPWTAAHQASLSITNSWSLLELMSVESVMPSSHLILCCPLLLLPSIFPGIRVFTNEWLSSLQQLAKILELQLQSSQWIFRTDFL